MGEAVLSAAFRLRFIGVIRYAKTAGNNSSRNTAKLEFSIVMFPF